MSRKEVPRVGLLKAAVARQIGNGEVARALEVTGLRTLRLKRRCRADAAAPCGRGRASPRR